MDALQVRTAARARDYAQVLAAEGALLGGLTVEEGGALERWLEAARQEFESLWARARAGELARLEEAGEIQAALALAEVWVRREPESEEAGRAVIRLHALLGNRTAALAAFERLQRALERGLDARPSPETIALARTVGRGARLPAATERSGSRPLPPSVLRPPVLAGREEAWRALEEGWAAGQLLVIVGSPGEGKTRLAVDFAESRGRWRYTGSRVGDREVPYASAARTLRTLLADRPDHTLPEWVRRELMRIPPELAGPGETPPPLASDADKLRLFQAAAETYAALSEGHASIVADDAQYIDPATNELMEYLLLAPVPARPAGQRLAGAVHLPARRGARGARWPGAAAGGGGARADRRARAAGARAGAHPARGASTCPGAERHAERLARYTGGNPLFVVETVKHLVETGALDSAWPERLPPPGRVGPLIQQRLTRLSPAALRLARIAALAGTDFSFELAAEVLEERALAVGEAAVELESAQVLSGERFSHDLVQEAVASGIPDALRSALHRRLAEVLEARRTPPIRVALHWMEARLPERALPFLLDAADVDEQAMRPREAAELYSRAATLLESSGRAAEAARARAAEQRCLERTRPGP